MNVEAAACTFAKHLISHAVETKHMRASDVGADGALACVAKGSRSLCSGTIGSRKRVLHQRP